MSYVRFNISDSERSIHGDLHGSLTDPLIASLTAEPETVDEFESALRRYIQSESDWPTLHGFRPWEYLEPYDAGLVAIDLAGRTIGYETSYTLPSAEGSVRVPNEFADDDGDIYIPYRLPDDWQLIETMACYEGIRDLRREERAKRPSFDARPVLFGRPLISHIVRSIADAPDPDAPDLVSDIHASWLMTRRTDLGNRTPRDVLFEKQDLIDFDLHTRSLQWSFTKVCPPGLSQDSFAYKTAGFGTHEWVLYYDLVRKLLSSAAAQSKAGLAGGIESEIERLSKVRDHWLRSPDSESWGRLPIDVIDLERRRINLTATAQEILIDENCPCCVALAEDFDTPMFTHLDGCNMDDRFEFSPFKTLEEYEDDIRRREEFGREFERKYKDDPEFAWKDGLDPF